MGNYISCTLSVAQGSHSRGIKVILPNSAIQQLSGPTNAAELMLEAPGYFLVNSRSMQVGRWFLPLSADEDLEMGNVYVMLPMARVNAVVAAADVGRLLIAANNVVRRASVGRARVLPDSGLMASSEQARHLKENPMPRLNLDVVGDGSVVEFKQRMTMCRPRRPMLETIAEEKVCYR